jgi:arylsulfatase A-like enzyme
MKRRRKDTLIKMIAVGSVLAVGSGWAPVKAEAATADEVQPSITPATQSTVKSGLPKNIIYIKLDDTGFSDLGSFGSEIKTPNIDQLAANGLRYTNYNTCPLSSPTRASILTGRESNAVGMGMTTGTVLGPDRPNLRGFITPEAATVAQILGGLNFSTMGVGKWHLNPTPEDTPVGPFNNWPLGKGFDHWYGFLPGESDQFHPVLISDNSMIDPPSTPGYHFSVDIIDKAIKYLANQISVFPNKPFFLDVNFGTAHSPLQVPKGYMEMYTGVYEKGWDKMRAERFEQQKKLGIIPQNTKLPANDPTVKPWDSLTKEQQTTYAAFMRAYAGFLTHADQQIGRLVEYLKKTGQFDNTLIFLVSDNGATPDGGPEGAASFGLAPLKPPVELSKIGTSDSASIYPKGWAQVSNTPFPEYKWTYYGGGSRTPLIVSWPQGIKDKGTIRSQYVHVSDITPTVLDILQIKTPETYNGVKQMPISGVSFAKTFNDASAASAKTVQFGWTYNSRSIYNNGWKALGTHKPGTSWDEDKWELFNLAVDFSESTNLAPQYPDKLKELKDLWMVEAGKNRTLPMKEVAGATWANPNSPARGNVFKFLPGVERIGYTATPLVWRKDLTITIPIERNSNKEQGVLVSHGDFMAGYSIYIKNNKLFYEYNNTQKVFIVESNIAVPTGKSTLKFEFKKKEGAPTNTPYIPGTATLYINNAQVGEAEIVTAGRFAFEGLDVGRDSCSIISKAFKTLEESVYTGKYEYVLFELKN